MWVALLIAAIFHGWNMFGFPYYENDEGTYLSQAWSLLSSGQLAPYTYWYDHAPAGWILIAIWTFFTGGFFTFGASVNSGRVLMLILHVLSAFFIFAVTKRLSKSTLAAFVATTIFSITPLGIYFQRRVLLDNIMTFWVLFSLWCLIRPYVTLRHIILSAVAFGIGVLTKENAVFFLPAFLYVLWLYTSKKRRGFAFVYWMSIMAGVISLYFLYAIIKSEFFPVGTFGDQSPRVSLITTLQEQLSRGVNKPFWSPGSEFRLMLTQWINKDATLIIGGILAVFINLLLSIKYAYFRIPVFLSFLMLIFLVR